MVWIDTTLKLWGELKILMNFGTLKFPHLNNRPRLPSLLLFPKAGESVGRARGRSDVRGKGVAGDS